MRVTPVAAARRRRRCCARPRTACPTCATTARASCALEPGDVAARRRPDRGLRGERRGRARSTRAAAPCCRASSTATRTCRSPAGGRRSTSARSPACPTRRSRAPAAGSRARRGRSPSASDDGGARAGARRSRAEMLAHGTTAFEGKTGYGLSREGEARAARLGRELADAGRAADAADRRCSPTRSRPATTADAWMDEAEALARELRRRRARHLRRVGRVRRTSTWRAWARSRASTGRAAARARRAVRRRTAPCRSRSSGARARSTTSRCLHPDDVAPLAAAECAAVLLPGRRADGRASTPPPARALADAGAICVLATDLNPGTSPIASMPVIVGLARAPLRLERARGAARGHAQRRLGARLVGRARLARAGQARRRAAARRPGRARPLPLRPQPGRGRVRAAASRPWVRPDQALAGAARDRARPSCATGSPGSSRSGSAPTARRGSRGRAELAAAEAWFGEQARAAGLRVERDPAGSLWALPDGAGPVVGDRLAPRQRPRRRALRRRARRRGGVRGRRARCPASR